MLDRQSSARPVRVALWISGGPAPAYVAAAAERLLAVEGVQLAVIVVDDGPSGRSTVRARAKAAVDRVYEVLERLVLPGSQRALAPTSHGLERRGVPVVRDEGVAGTVRGTGLDADVLVDLRWARRADHRSLAVPPLGSWRLVFANAVDGPRHDRPARPAAPSALVVSALQIELLSGARLETGVGFGAVHRAGFSRDRDAILWRAAHLPARRLTRLVAGESIPSQRLDVAGRPGPTGPRPGSRVDAPFRALARRALAKGIERVAFQSAWFVLVRDRRPGDPPPRDLTSFRRLEAPAGRFYADPFVADQATGPRILVEDSPLGRHRGRITSLRRDPGGTWGPEAVLLEDLAHRAYPHALATDLGLVLTPDGGRSGGVDVFVVDDLAAPPRHVATCLEGVPASDPTLLWHAGRFWLFAGVTGFGMQPWDELHLWFAESLAGPWVAHPANPVVADVRRARPAGRIFALDGTLVRPGQDCSAEYGGRIVLSAITALTPDAYEERPLAAIEPNGLPGVTRTHTYSFGETVEALDGYARRRRLSRRQPRRH